MPYPNEHAARVRDPADFQPDSFRRVDEFEGRPLVHEGKKYWAIVGRLKAKTTTRIQALRYKKADGWTASAARAHAEAHGASGFAAASGASQESRRTREAVWSTAKVNDLPDSSFGYVEPGGSKDAQGKTVPRSLRHFPYKNADGTPDAAHVRNALARVPQSNVPAAAKGRALAKVRAAAARIGIKVSMG